MTEDSRQDGKKFQEMFSAVESAFSSELDGMKQLEVEMRQRMAEVCGDPENRNRRAGASPLTFMSTMYENLISLRNARLAAVKDIATVKKMAADLQMKSDKGEGDDDAFRRVAQNLMQMLAEAEERGARLQPRTAGLIPDGRTLEALDLAAEEAARSMGAPDPAESEAPPEEKHVVDRATGEVYLVDSDYRVKGEVVEPERFQVIRNKKGVVVSAMDTLTGQKLEVVE